MTTNASMYREELGEASVPNLGIARKTALAALCLAGGIAPLAARSISSRPVAIVYGLVVAAVLMGITVLFRQAVSLQPLWQLPFACFVLALVQVLNNAVPPFFLSHVLREHTVDGNPLASTIGGTLVIQLLDTALAIVPIVVLIKLFRLGLDSINWKLGPIGVAHAIALLGFVAIYLLIGISPAHHVIPLHETVSLSRYRALTPALLVLVISNGFQEEFLFRGLFLPRYTPIFGAWPANALQALVFAYAHVGVTYSPNALIFILAAVFPLGLLAGWLMQRSQGVVAPAVLHAGLDIPIYLAFLTAVA